MDPEGVILSVRNKENLGLISLYKDDIPQERRYGSFTSERGGMKKQIVYCAVGGTGWTLIKEIPFDEFLRDTRIIQWSVLGLILVSSLISFILVYYLIRAATRPLKELSNAMNLLEKPKDVVNDLGSRMVVGGDGSGNYNPDQAVTRAEFAAIVVRGLGLKPNADGRPFSDIQTSD